MENKQSTEILRTFEDQFGRLSTIRSLEGARTSRNKFELKTKENDNLVYGPLRITESFKVGTFSRSNIGQSRFYQDNGKLKSKGKIEIFKVMAVNLE